MQNLPEAFHQGASPPKGVVGTFYFIHPPSLSVRGGVVDIENIYSQEKKSNRGACFSQNLIKERPASILSPPPFGRGI
jgi:hypothetical protein